MGSPCLFTRQRGVKIRYFYWLRVKNSNPFHTELSLGYLKDAKFYLKSKASFIDISSITSFKLVLIAWLQKYRTFSDSSVVSFGQNTPFSELFSEKQSNNRVPLSNFFSSSNVLFIHLFIPYILKQLFLSV